MIIKQDVRMRSTGFGGNASNTVEGSWGDYIG